MNTPAILSAIDQEIARLQHARQLLHSALSKTAEIHSTTAKTYSAARKTALLTSNTSRKAGKPPLAGNRKKK